MTDSLNPPLSYEASATTTHRHEADSLPSEVVVCLKNSRFLHLATCDNLTPHISLMSYTYLPSTPYDPYPTIIMTTNPASRKTNHLLSNPRLSLLVHDWVSHRPPTRAPNPDGREGSPHPQRAWCKERHLENNTFEEEEITFGQQQRGDPSQRRPSMSIDSDVRVVTVQVREGRIADWKGGVRDWVLLPREQEQAGLVNGV
ncbi:FMN-binding split barrel-related protein [Penicillium cosmopolitanum]|uniref:FMN-binding split barrel-related protein n=1 Tax=Penicillium cosmopolitanum TaxID=1131564 RepID=A0A9X0B9N9_9EURO|nr:FMN-binding split barrel-related protein [Penicillium cosmopolitanum]KAJ5396874.1 FMN-binding split barrel-related protein [Penicillium cosmopolitanum]